MDEFESLLVEEYPSGTIKEDVVVAKKAKTAETEAEAEAEAGAEAARREKHETHEEERRAAADAARFGAEILALQRMARIEAEEAARSSEFALSAAASDYGDGHGDLFDDGDDFDASPFYDDERGPDGDGGGDLFDGGDDFDASPFYDDERAPDGGGGGGDD